MSGASDHNKSLDGLRGIAALFVVLYHMEAFVGVAASGSGLYTQDTLVWQLFRRAIEGNFSVALFFVLSGYVLVAGFDSGGVDCFRYSFIKRYFRLTPVVLASVFVAYLLSVTVGFHNREAAVNMGGHDWLSSQYVGSLTFWGAIKNGLWGAYSGDVSYNGPLWTIRLELIGSLVLFGFSSLFYKSNLFVLYVAVFSFFMSVIFGLDGLYVSLFLMGAVLQKVKSFRLPLWSIVLVVPLATQNPWTREMVFLKDLLALDLDLDVFFHAIAAVMLVSLVIDRRVWVLSSRWVVFLGKLSFSLYALHIPVMMSFGAWVFNVGCVKGLCGAYAVYSMGVSLVFSLLGAVVFYYFVDVKSQVLASWVVGLVREYEGCHKSSGSRVD